MLIINEKIALKKFLSTNSYSFLLTTFSIAFIVWVIQSVNNLEIVSEDGHSFLVYFYYTLLIFPKIIGKILPAIFFVTLFHTLIKYENNNELKIFWINGVSKIKFYNVILKYTIIFFVIQVFITSFLGPHLQNKAREYIKESTLDFFPSLFQEKKFIDTVEKLTIFIESKNTQNDLKNIYLKDDSSTSSRIIIAKKGRLLIENNSRVLRLYDGKFINIDLEGRSSSFNFDRTDFNLSKFETKTITYRKLQETNISELLICLNYILIKKEIYFEKFLTCNKNSVKETISEVYKRIFKPFYLFLLSLIVIFLLVFL
jgi:lipopolysaccharide export system permease protein